ncbi:hypothetical protein [Polaromonas sp.]|uniref:hypothetical protein n=1 Tax=Polaromonas sp. TaxID=1869339 RepID=UPI0025FE4BB2|nr:hypothetical protein [Polaromonas sp.]
MMAVQAGNVVLMMASLPSPIGQLKAGKLLTLAMTRAHRAPRCPIRKRPFRGKAPRRKS